MGSVLSFPAGSEEPSPATKWRILEQNGACDGKKYRKRLVQKPLHKYWEPYRWVVD